MWLHMPLFLVALLFAAPATAWTTQLPRVVSQPVVADGLSSPDAVNAASATLLGSSSSSLSRRVVLRLLGALPAAPALCAFAAEDAVPSQGFVTDSGLRYFDFRDGQGTPPRWGQLIRLHYVAYTVDGSSGGLLMFDSTYERKEPYFTKHGNGQTIRGLEEAMHGMKPGGRRRVIVPAGKLSYITDKGPVPPQPKARKAMYKAVDDQEPLIFDVELVTVMDDLVDRGDYEDSDVFEYGARLQASIPPADLSSTPATPDTPETEAEAKRRKLRELGLSTELSEAGEAAAAAKLTP